MKTGNVTIDFDKMKDHYPYSTTHILDVLSDKQNVSYEVKPEDNDNFDPEENKYRVRFTYTKRSFENETFTLLMDEKFITFT